MNKTFILITALLFALSCNNSNKNIIIGQKISASSEFKTREAITLVDEDTTLNNWNSGRNGEDFITLEFDKNYKIDSVSFLLSSDPSCKVMINILSTKDGVNFEPYISEEKQIGSLNRLTYIKSIENSKGLRIVVNNQCSWISMYNLNVLGR